MPFEITPALYPAIGAVVAALVAGGIAYTNLVASKESKVSEFRQTWIDALRDDLAALFSNTRTLARAYQEFRSPPPPALATAFGIAPEKITEVRHGAAETYHRIRLRLNPGQDDHKELLRLIGLMMTAQQAYMNDEAGSVDAPLAAVEAAAKNAEGVLKTEWTRVKKGEVAYRIAVGAAALMLVGFAGLLTWFFVVSANQSANTQASPASAHASAAVPKAAPVPAPKPAPAAPAATTGK
jgi:hypothetical protein